jgi:hypothetical protein
MLQSFLGHTVLLSSTLLTPLAIAWYLLPQLG